ncbi:MAG: aminodeoxychorismate/anthranilate synthase component II [Methanospirillum sp.]|uniref:anthranilate synthase component II n=1 Tax=Methanospirillum sp. TaxID=45200 RepID=UPI0023718E88|nr:aminodeoxychorismate/anthranilate synthase component II [Methanospirillum sp.]MDD1727616.1 aminodeoxychorismate/anthranilate synthase component II [Methanospirillum sp.]
MNVTIVDCFDSFTYNLHQLVGTLGGEPVAITCDQEISRIERENPDRIILSPGPGTPTESGVCREVIEQYAGVVPILGVCLGHQTIIHTFGGRIVRLDEPVHGKTSKISHTETGLFQGIPQAFTATRYHSLTADRNTLPREFHITATSQGDDCIMAVSHEKLPIHGVQFHPESIMTPAGRLIMTNFLATGGV